MSKIKFYTVFSILNILLTTYIAGSIFVALFLMFYNLFYTPNTIFLLGIIIYTIYAILKLLLPKIFINWSDKHKSSLINKFVEFIHNNPQQKKFILPLAFCFDLPFILYQINSVRDTYMLFYVPLIYFILYTGGVFLFYIMLYRGLQIKDGEIKPFF